MQEAQKDGRKRANVKLAAEVEIVQKQHQRTGELTHGFVLKILTKSSHHPHGIKVMLESGEVGRVKNVLEEED
ncbi:MAG: YwbE family protein [Bacteroidota bacterium]